MIFKLNNFAKIKHAEIEIDGITVIAGNNNTGKSTIGKALFSMFSSLHDIGEQIENKRKGQINSIISRGLRNVIMHRENFLEKSSRVAVQSSNSISRKIVPLVYELDSNMFDETAFAMGVDEVLQEYGLLLSDTGMNRMIEYCYSGIVRAKEMDGYRIAKEIIGNEFQENFNSQIQCLKNDNEAEIELIIRNKRISVRFSENECVEWNPEIDLLNEAFFIDDPFILDDIQSGRYGIFDCKPTKAYLIKRLLDIDENDNIIEAIIIKEKLQKIYNIINDVAPGQIRKQGEKWALDSDYYNAPVLFDNLSAGLKSFVLLRMLLEKGMLHEKDILIFDEPEIHLHPEWQIKFAELIILLQKEFDLSIIVTTHSRDFFEALELFAKKHKINDKCRYYLANQSEGIAEFENVTTDETRIYKHLIQPNRLLDTLRFELEDEADD